MEDKKLTWLKQIPEKIGWYLAGFSDGEGSFNVSLRKNKIIELNGKLF